MCERRTILCDSAVSFGMVQVMALPMTGFFGSKLADRVRRAAVTCLVLFVLFSSSRTLQAAPSQFLPRLFGGDSISTVGVALLNPGLTDVSATFRWPTSGGRTIASTSRTIAAKVQFATTLKELFPQVTETGWLAIE